MDNWNNNNWKNDTWSSNQNDLTGSDGYTVQEGAGDDPYGTAYQYAYSLELEEGRVQSVMTMSFVFMFVALCISAMAAQFTITSGLIVQIVFNNTLLGGLLVAELVIVVVADICLDKNLLVPSVLFFIAYSVINGMTLSVILLAYTASSVVSIFIMAALVFGAMAVFGAVTKKDLTGIGQIGFMLLLGIIIMGIVNFGILKSSGLDLVLSGLGLAIFIGLTAYDTQKIKEMAMADMNRSATVVGLAGALALYLDFINLFLKLLRLFGKRR